jgi:hypothetical protein
MRVVGLGFGVACIAGVALVACGGVAETGLFSSPDGGSPAEAGAVAWMEGGTKTPGKPDAGHTGTGNDAGHAGTPDAPVATSTPDSSTTTPVPDATAPSKDTGPPPPTLTTIQCLNGPCTGSPPVCCVSVTQGGTSSACTTKLSDCSGQGQLPLTCGSSADCASGETCCVTLGYYNQQSYPKSVTCQASCNSMTAQPFCNTNDNTITCTGQNAYCQPFYNSSYGACSTYNGQGMGGQGGH